MTILGDNNQDIITGKGNTVNGIAYMTGGTLNGTKMPEGATSTSINNGITTSNFEDGHTQIEYPNGVIVKERKGVKTVSFLDEGKFKEYSEFITSIEYINGTIEINFTKNIELKYLEKIKINSKGEVKNFHGNFSIEAGTTMNL